MARISKFRCRLSVLIVSNFEGFPAQWQASDGLKGRSVYARTPADFLRWKHETQAVFLVNCDPALTLSLATRRAFHAFSPALIAVDLILRRPVGIRQRLATWLKRRAFRHVDRFIHYFRDVGPLNEVYGIGPERSLFVPFKANLWQYRSSDAQPEGEYILCFGRSLRDFDTFFTAVERAGYPAAIVDPSSVAIFEHGSRFTRTLSALPANVTVLEHDLTAPSQASVLRGAKLVVIPILKETIVSAGISTALNAMLLGKCVIASAGPGVSDIFDGELIAVPPEDPLALEAAIRAAWQDDTLRRKRAERGLQYATACGTVDDFYRRIIDTVSLCYHHIDK